MQTELQTDKIVQDIRKILGVKWNEKIWTFLSSKEMKNIINDLIELKQSGKYFVPSLKDAFNPYRRVDPGNINVVIISGLKTSNTVLATNGNEYPLQPNSVQIQKVLDTISTRDSISMQNWSAQGVLQVSTAMTSTLMGKHHYDIWKVWITYIINKINEIALDAPVIFIGKEAMVYRQMIRSENVFVIDTWPVTNAHNCWLKVNNVLLEQNKAPIKWVDEVVKLKRKNAATRRAIAARQFYGAKKRVMQSVGDK